MDRRGVLRIGGVVGMGTIAGCTDLMSETIENDWIDSHKWSDTTLELHFQSDHGVDGFAVMHADDHDREYALAMGKTPQFEGPIELPFIRLVEEEDSVYPSLDFKVELLLGEFSEWDQEFSFNYTEEKAGEYTFEVPESVMPSEYLRS